MDDELYYDENTLNKVREVLRKNGYLAIEIPGVMLDFQNAGILFRERQPYPDLEFSSMDLEQAVFTALGAASSCWENLEGAGVFESDRCKNIGDQLIARIRQAQPIYG